MIGTFNAQPLFLQAMQAHQFTSMKMKVKVFVVLGILKPIANGRV